MKLVLSSALVTGFLFISPLLAKEPPGQRTHCQLGEAVRVIAVVYPQGGELPCEVRYSKDGTTNVLWQAKNDAGYCEQQAADFVAKQRGWGFECVVMPAASAMTVSDETQY
ncbi:hypothetical protein WG68_16340 [Arsukibacterium ikkense]|uniref:Ig-like domain-containing protein n=1 Tax=Arsukibacterium ikkense TaxID=336831 RepID=A0A0M2V5D3_9GAMM|nr:hypothetical protein [Arsukibacterium ikkense]KKO44383.1 hypothetical protein WG68_16340 [Arsukibacterium ikkense]